jgi:hypothetical protein
MAKYWKIEYGRNEAEGTRGKEEKKERKKREKKKREKKKRKKREKKKREKKRKRIQFQIPEAVLSHLSFFHQLLS